VILALLFSALASPDGVALEKLCTAYFDHQAQRTYWLHEDGVMDRVPDMSLAYYRREAAYAGKLMAELASLDETTLDLDQRITLAMMRRDLGAAIAYPDQGYWLEFDLLPYHLGYVLANLGDAARGFVFRVPADKTAYTTLLDSADAMWREQLVKLRAQDAKGIRMPKPTFPAVLASLKRARESLPEAMTVTMDRMDRFYPEGAQTFCDEIETRLREQTVPAIDALIAFLEGDYRDRAPETVGLWQYPGGPAYYRAQIRWHTSRELDPDTIHQMGLDRVAELETEMRAGLKKHWDLDVPLAEAHVRIREKAIAASPEQLGKWFDRWVARARPKLDRYFSLVPKAPYGVARLDPASEAGMTFGYYQIPTQNEKRGLYRYNGSNLSERPMVWGAALTYHELVPGHHFHLGLQAENEALWPYRRRKLDLTAFNEGWANYAAWVAGHDLGLYTEALDEYGFLLFDMFDTVRLVVDTGLNHKRWSLKKARAYMARYLIQSETEIASETLRYATDLPGQALAYELGAASIREMREKAETALGDRFDIRAFHATVLGGGAVPMPQLETRVDHYIRTGKTP